MAGKRAALITDAVVHVSHTMQRVFDVQFAPIIGGLVMAQINPYIAKGLIGAAVFFVARPQRIDVELQPFGFQTTKNHRSQSAVANWQGFS